MKTTRKKITNWLFLISLALGASVAEAHVEHVVPLSAWASQTQSAYSPNSAIDGDAGTIWASGAFPYQWLAVETGFLTISHVELVVSMSPAGYASHEIHVHDGTQWSHVTTVSGNMSDGQVLTVPINRWGQYVWIRTMQSPSWVNWREVHVYQLVDQAPSAPQFVAKVYTEALGRAPEAGGFDYWTSTIRNSGCSIAELRRLADETFRATEYWSRPYGTAERLMTLYRGIFSREPDQSGFDFYLGEINQGRFSETLDTFLNSAEFAQVAARACSVATPGYAFGARLFDYPQKNEWGAVPVAQPVVYGRQYTTAEVEGLLNSNAVVELDQNSIVRVTSSIRIPAGKELRTLGTPSTNAYAKMARLVRASDFNDALIKLSPGAKLRHVWVDGGRGDSVASDGTRNLAMNIDVESGHGSVVESVRADNSTGATTIHAHGRNSSTFGACSGNEFRNNLVTSYSSRYHPIGGTGVWTDGLTIKCEDSVIEGNEIIDATDAAIVLFSGYPGSRAIPPPTPPPPCLDTSRLPNAPQKSLVKDNLILNAGNSAYWGIGFEPFAGFDPCYPYPRMFDGAVIQNNYQRTSDMVHVATALGAGTRSLWGLSGVFGWCQTPAPAAGEVRELGTPQACSLKKNTFSGRTAIGIGLNGMTGVEIGGGTEANSITISGIPTGKMISRSFSCTKTTAAQPIVCPSGSGICPVNSITNPSVYEACY